MLLFKGTYCHFVLYIYKLAYITKIFNQSYYSSYIDSYHSTGLNKIKLFKTTT